MTLIAHRGRCPRCGSDPQGNAEFRSALAAQSAAHAGSAAPQWQPIETAPMDTQLLLAAEFDGPGDWRIKTGYFDSKSSKWALWGASWKPTRWMPLPALPST